MPLAIAGTWVGVGAVLIVVVMLLAALIPRPGAEIALSRVPWQRSSSDDLRASQVSVVKDGAGKDSPETAADDNRTANDGRNNGQNNGQKKRPEQGGDPSNPGGESAEAGDGSNAKREGENSGSAVDEAGKSAGADQKGAGVRY